MSRTPEYSAWRAMLSRCYKPNHPKYPHYGGRGISVCSRWRESFFCFLMDVGNRPFPNASIGRIDNDGNYEPSNVRWETPKQQMRNTTWNRKVTIAGITQTLSGWVETTGIGYKTIQGRIKSGWPESELLSPPDRHRKRKLTEQALGEVRRLVDSGARRVDVASQFGISLSLVHLIVNRKTWA